jgi:glycosyltransferase involved in cell wall biosynthesis
MKICLVSTEYPPETGGGGIGTQTHLKAVGLAARGHEVHVVSSSAGDGASVADDAGATIHRIPEPQLFGPGWEESSYWLAYSVAVAEKLYRLDEQVGFDLFQFPEYGGEGFVYQTDTWAHRKARYVVQLHGPLAMFSATLGWPETGSPLHAIGCFMEQTVIQHADLVLSSSLNTARFVADTYGQPLDRIQVVHSGIDATRFAPAPSGGAGGPRVLFVGNLVEGKGVFAVAGAAARLRRRYPELRLRVIGKGDEHAHARLRAAFADAPEAVELVGYTPYAELPGHYAWADMLAAPSRFEPGPGNVYLEAMAAARPVIAARTGGAPEVVLDGTTGLLVDPGDIEGIESAIATLTDDRALAAALGARGRALVEERFALDRYIDRIEALYEQVLRR